MKKISQTRMFPIVHKANKSWHILALSYSSFSVGLDVLRKLRFKAINLVRFTSDDSGKYCDIPISSMN